MVQLNWVGCQKRFINSSMVGTGWVLKRRDLWRNSVYFGYVKTFPFSNNKVTTVSLTIFILGYSTCLYLQVWKALVER